MNGLGQEGVLLPSLFNVYLNNLLVQLVRSGDGGKVHGLFIDCLAYEDDYSVISDCLWRPENAEYLCSEQEKCCGSVCEDLYTFDVLTTKSDVSLSQCQIFC